MENLIKQEIDFGKKKASFFKEARGGKNMSFLRTTENGYALEFWGYPQNFSGLEVVSGLSKI